ncbi:exodeoxyribonuclease VII large subunit [Beduini massiliensis]|uniref:exodeoxyribonuclease VII large subunit n=1 Tax=Beduini massiliensis TaxID=1585974 RepID=UPI00059AAD4B|nr:exodeoxyribonuclease VII large subunit [Beduini massiliensis]
MEQRYLTVSALNNYLKAKLDQDVHLQKIFLQGEISNLKLHSSGHYYFTLKDEKSRINAVMFSSYVQKLKIRLENGMKVLIVGSISVYVAAGNFQLYVYHVEPDGIGNLYIQFEQLKKKLYNEGLFEDTHKKRIPLYPQEIGIITAYPSAALEDILRTLHNRFPLVKVKLFPTLVQGESAYQNIIRCLKQADSLGLDVLILARGGGSLEDLWNFNNEELVRTIYHCQTPIISGVGHEVDTTLTDYVADLRAATPTAAATAAVPDLNELLMQNDATMDYLQTLMMHQLENTKTKLVHLSQHPCLKEPQRMITKQQEKLGMHTLFLKQQMSLVLKHYRYQLSQLDQKIVPMTQQFIQKQYYTIEQQTQQMQYALVQKMNTEKQHFGQLLEQLQLLSPLNILKRGYAIVETNGHVVDSVLQVKPHDEIAIRLSDGTIKATVKE